MQSSEVPKYLELLADNEEFSAIGSYEVPKSVRIACLTKTPEVQCVENLPKVKSQDLDDKSMRFKRSSIASLDLPDYKRTSIYSIGKKCRTLDNLKTACPNSRSPFSRDSLTSLSDWRRYKKSVIGERGSETSLDSSSASLAPSTRPSSSVMSQQNVQCDAQTSPKTALPKLLKANLQNGKANIPLVINSALLNLLRQTPSIDDGGDVVTYTNISSEGVRVNGS